MTLDELKKERDGLALQHEDYKAKMHQVWGALTWVNAQITAMEKQEKPNG